MRTTMLAFALTAVALHPADARISSPVFSIDPARSIAQFTVTKLGFEDVTGTFREMSGEIRWHAPEPEAGFVRWRVKVASVATDSRDRNSALKQPEYFDARRHPELMFESTRVRALSPGRLELTGQLTMRGASRPVTLIVGHSGTAAAPIFETDFEINRYDFGIAGGTAVGRLIGRTVRIHLRAVTGEPTS